MSKLSWKDINGKTINYRTMGKIIASLVIANPEIGISIKPLDPKDVPLEGGWNIPPSDPNFYFICTRATMESCPSIFNHWVKILSQDKKLFGMADFGVGGPGNIGFLGTCPFS